MAPERLNIMPPKRIAAEGTLTLLNRSQRETESGITVREYASG